MIRGIIAAGLVMLIFPLAFAEEGESAPEGTSYVTGPAIGVGADKNSEARDWAMCSAAYKVAAQMFFESGSASAKRTSDLGNGAEVAAWVTLIVPIVSEMAEQESPDPERFATAWEMTKTTSEGMVESAITRLASDLEIHRSKGTFGQWAADLGRTVEVCADNSKLQEMKLDVMREFMTSGLLTLPEEN